MPSCSTFSPAVSNRCDEIALAVLADVIAHAEILPAQLSRIDARILVRLVDADYERYQHDRESVSLEYPAHFAHRLAVVGDVFKDVRA